MEFLIQYVYGQGQLYAFIEASSANEIARLFPELEFVERPFWMTPEEEAAIRAHNSFDVKSPTGWLLLLQQSRPSPAEIRRGGA